MTDIKHIPESLRNDILACLVNRYGHQADHADVELPGGTKAKLPRVELRVPKKDHDDLSQKYFLAVEADDESIILSFIQNVGFDEFIMKA